MLLDILTQLKETTTQLGQLRSEIESIIKQNEIAISNVERMLIEEKKEVAGIKTGSKGKAAQNSQLKTINELWRDNGDGLLVIKKPAWTPDFCFLVHSIEGICAKGISYRLNSNGEIEEYKKYTFNADDAQFRLLQGDEEKLKRAVMSLTGEKASNTTASDKCNTNGTSGKQAKVGCIVSILCCESNEEAQLKILPSYDHVRYTTMGYKTKNYVELTRTSDADGVNSISDESPLGKAIIGKRAGDEITVDINGEVCHYRIISISDEQFSV